MLRVIVISIRSRGNWNCSWPLSVFKVWGRTKILRSWNRLGLSCLLSSGRNLIPGLWLSFIRSSSASNCLGLSIGSDAPSVCLILVSTWSAQDSTPEIFNQFLILFTKVAFPYHDNRILTCRGEIVTTWGEISRSRSPFMTVEGVQNVALSEIPDLDGRVVGGWEKESSIRVESDWIYSIWVGIIVLEESWTSYIPDLYWFVSTTTSNASTIRVKP